MITALLSSNDLEIGYRARRATKSVFKNLDLKIMPGQFICFCGPNGSGKSTLLRTLSGLQNPLSGVIQVNGKAFEDFSSAQRSQVVAVILTDSIDAMGLSAHDVVGLGRIPYLGWSGKLKVHDHEVIDQVIRQVDIESLAHRPFVELSDGEKQRVLIGRALAQEPQIMILDEPTAHLDLTWRVEVMLLLRKLCRDRQLGIVMSSHDFDLALRLADAIWLMTAQEQWQTGIPEELALKGAFNQLFTNEHLNFDISSGSWKIYEKSKGAVFVNGQGAAKLWTQKLVARLGFSVESTQTKININIVYQEEDRIEWILEAGGSHQKFQNLKSLENFLKVLGAQAKS